MIGSRISNLGSWFLEDNSWDVVEVAGDSLWVY